jgi:hypothetical protein
MNQFSNKNCIYSYIIHKCETLVIEQTGHFLEQKFLKKLAVYIGSISKERSMIHKSDKNIQEFFTLYSIFLLCKLILS